MSRYYDYDHHHHHGHHTAPVTRRYTTRDAVPYHHSHSRSSSNTSHPSRYIVNDGNLVIDDKTFRRTHTYIHNRPGSTMWVQPTSSSSSHHDSYLTVPAVSTVGWSRQPQTLYAPPLTTTTTAWQGSSPAFTTSACRECLTTRRQLYGGYCLSCVESRMSVSIRDSPRPLTARLEGPLRDSPRYSSFPERRLIEYR